MSNLESGRIRQWFRQIVSRLRLWMIRLLSRYGGRLIIARVMWWTQSKFLVAIVAVVFWGDRVLLLEHSYRPRYPWGLPTGWIRYGESLEAAVRRELREECELQVGALRWIDSGFPARRHLECIFWAEVVETFQRRESSPSVDGEIISWDWFRWENDLPERLLPAQRPLIERAVGERYRFYAMQKALKRDDDNTAGNT